MNPHGSRPQPAGTGSTGLQSRPPLSVSFHNFYRGFDRAGSYFVRALGQRYAVSIDRRGRDLQISSVFGSEPLPAIPGARPLRMWWSGEARDPYGQLFDIHFGSNPHAVLGRGRWYRHPLWTHYIDWWSPDSPYTLERLLAPRRHEPKPRFCNFIFTQKPSVRTEFFFRLNALRPVDSFGVFLNNQGVGAADRTGKMAALARSTFTIAFENQISPGYVTEKLVEPLMVGSIPIYWGASEARTDFNPAAFIAATDFPSLDDLARHLVDLADSPERLAEITTAPVFPDNRIAEEFTPGFFVDRIDEALSGDLAGRIPESWSAAGSGRGRIGQAISRARRWIRRPLGHRR